eukprot:TRINITY_DN1205_c0_g1_i1.p1 TRINITY_DN1205_c0_g1~~TRINITY_DN1205_c0_g1_i1.p1  ORF type:complete len:226 (+),score=34.09 TRINITY_DN1205_c0_g1_i1:111-788(+)
MSRPGKVLRVASTFPQKQRKQMSIARLGRLAPETTALLVCDIQEAFRAPTYKFPLLVQSASTAMKCAKALNIPILVTEQYPKGLGKTVKELDVTGCSVTEKNVFSMIVPDVKAQLKSIPDLKSVLITGMETHVCVLQTALDLIQDGVEVHILTDAVGSISKFHKKIGVKRLEQSGAYITTVESAMFQMLHSSAHPQFRAISGIIKTHNQQINTEKSKDKESKADK